jgi:acetoin utilization deacetylase AcuC-like enzyme
MSVALVINPKHDRHAVDGHPERPERVEAVVSLLRESGLMARLQQIDPRDTTDEELALVHTRGHIDTVRSVCERGGGWFDPDTYCLRESCAAAWSAAGACLAATDAVLRGQTRSAFCAVRPPGHHARPQQAMGFCLLNNVALAGQYARSAHGLERVAIIDIDVHHGNGTQDAFYDDAHVLYVSTHQYPFYPGTGPMEETGGDEARGANVNIPLPASSGDAQYRAAFEQVVEPVVRRFQPELLLVSCGFDAHFADPLAMLSLSVDGYGELTERIRALADDLCDGRVVVALEGGYDLTAVAWSARRVIETLLGDGPTPDPLGPAPEGRPVDISGLLGELRALHGV